MLKETVRAAGEGLSLQSYELMPTKKQEVIDLLSDTRKVVRCCSDEHNKVHMRGNSVRIRSFNGCLFILSIQTLCHDFVHRD